MADQPLFTGWGKLQQRFEELTAQLTAGAIDAKQRHTLQKEHSYLNTLLGKYRELRALEKQLAEVAVQRDQTVDIELKALYEEEITDLGQQKAALNSQLEELMFPPDELDRCGAYIEIRAGAGGQEAALFAGNLARMYSNYALAKGWRVGIVDCHETDLKGYKEVVLALEGKGVYGALRFEAGTHRVQRVPSTEASGRIHTSTATVAIFPIVTDDEQAAINPSDLRIDVFRAGGAGGQHVNKTESAVRITHIPTGVVVSCQDDRSQHKNKAKALKMLQSRLLIAKREKEEAERSGQRKQMVGSGERAEKVRTYNFPQNRITDHQVELTLNKLDRVLEGELDEIVQALQEKARQDRRKQPLYIL